MYQATKAIQHKYTGPFTKKSDVMEFNTIVVKNGEITFKDTQQTTDYDEIRIQPSNKWIYSKKTKVDEDKITEIERWYPMTRISEVRKTVVRNARIDTD